MNKLADETLKSILFRLEKITHEVMSSQGYNTDTEKLKILVELTREQVKNENPGYGAGEAR